MVKGGGVVMKITSYLQIRLIKFKITLPLLKRYKEIRGEINKIFLLLHGLNEKIINQVSSKGS